MCFLVHTRSARERDGGETKNFYINTDKFSNVLFWTAIYVCCALRCHQSYRVHPLDPFVSYEIYNNNRANRNHNLLLVGWLICFHCVSMPFCFGLIRFGMDFNGSLCCCCCCYNTDTVVTHLPSEFDEHLYLRFISKWQWWCNNADDDTNENQVSPSEYFITVIIWPIVYHVPTTVDAIV